MSDVNPRPSGRRATVDRWIASLQPMFDVITFKTQSLRLGEPRLTSGPTLMKKDFFSAGSGGDRIRKGAVWFIGGKNVGFHVDFLASGIHIEAWQSKERHASVWISGKVSESSLKKDLTIVLAAAGLTDLARTNEVRKQLFPSKKAKE